MIVTVKEAIEILNTTYATDLEEEIVITWWDSSDFKGMVDGHEIADDALDVCVGHVNDWVGENCQWNCDEHAEEDCDCEPEEE
jgi:hypothetical protein